MHFLLTLSTSNAQQQLPANYQYPLSAVIYRILQRADNEYADFLHNSGYKKEESLKSFKLFSFSDIKTPFRNIGDRLLLLTQNAELVVSFHLPKAAENFIKGIFSNQQIEIGDKKSRVIFFIDQVTSLPLSLTDSEVQEVMLNPISPLVAGIKNDKGEYSFLSPEHPEFIRLLLYNWKEKYATVYGTQEAGNVFAYTKMEVIFYANPPKSRLITIKAYSPAETKIRGFINFRLKVHAGKEALELLLNAGAGVYNSLGMGCMEIVA
jgi:CRISPR-associated endoribonuclease Cas6